MPFDESRPHEGASHYFDPAEVALWRQMTPREKADLVSHLSREADARLSAEIRATHPDVSEREVFLRKAIRRLGHDLAVEAFPDAANLTD